jgi:hypothetical protein
MPNTDGHSDRCKRLSTVHREISTEEVRMTTLLRLFAGAPRIGSLRFRRRMKRMCIRFLTRLHDRTAILRNMHHTG